MKKQPVIAVIGAGALGVMFGQRMTQTLGPQRVFFAADAQRAARYAAQSFTCNGAACTFRFVTRQQAQPAALAVFAVKSTGLAAAIETMRPFIGPETLVISLLNGITSEGELAAAYGTEHVLYCVDVYKRQAWGGQLAFPTGGGVYYRYGTTTFSAWKRLDS